MITEEGKIKLVDFGFACEGGGSGNVRVGTPRYMSPDVLNRKYSPADDIWALGVSMFHLFTAEFPFDADSMEGLTI